MEPTETWSGRGLFGRAPSSVRAMSGNPYRTALRRRFRRPLLVGASAVFWLVFAAYAHAAITTIGGPGTGNGTFASPDSVAVDLAGDVYVLDAHRGTLQEFSNAGNYIGGISGGNSVGLPTHDVGGVTVDGNEVYVADPDDGQVRVFGAGFAPDMSTSGAVAWTGSSFIAVTSAPCTAPGCGSFIYLYHHTCAAR